MIFNGKSRPMRRNSVKQKNYRSFYGGEIGRKNVLWKGEFYVNIGKNNRSIGNHAGKQN